MGTRGLTLAMAAALVLACNAEPASETTTTTDAPAKPEPTPSVGEPATSGEPSAAPSAAPIEGSNALLVRLLGWLPGDTLAVSYDRMPKRWSPSTISAVFAIPPKAAMLLDERRLLDEALDQAFEAENGETDLSWLGTQSLAFTLPIIRHAYLVRPLLRPPGELDPIFLAAGFMREELEGKVVWLPKGAFPWRMAILDDQTLAFVPVDPGAGVQVLIDALAAPPSVVETQVVDALGQDPMIELTLLAGGPLLHYDTDAAITQLQFALRNAGPTAGYEGMVILMPDGDVDECANQLRARSLPEENQQVQALVGKVVFTPEPSAEPPQVIGRLSVASDQLKHFLERP